jgi:hypothetical protein
MASANKITLDVIVNGTPTAVEANIKAPLQVVAQQALNQTHQQGKPLSEWQLCDTAGTVLDLSRTVESYGFASGTTLYLQPKVGVNGGHGRVALHALWRVMQ